MNVRTGGTKNVFRLRFFYRNSDTAVRGLRRFISERGVVGWKIFYHPQKRGDALDSNGTGTYGLDSFCPNMPAVLH